MCSALSTHICTGAYTTQLVTIDPTRGNAIVQIPANFSVPTTLTARDSPAFTLIPDWTLNTTITNGTSVLVDGGKRDRLVWSGDMLISLPTVAVTTYDIISTRNALDSLFAFQYPSGQFPYAGFPTNLGNVTSFTYHLYALMGIANVYQWDADTAYVAGKWARWKIGMEWAVSQIDGTGLANVSVADARDWAREGQGGHNVAANALLFHTLNLGAALARMQDEHALGERWAALAARIREVVIPLLRQPKVGLFRDNETTTLAPQDGNAWAVKSGLVTDPSQVARISEALQARWGTYGAPAPEAPDVISPFISGFELETHFTANRTEAALSLIRSMWADFMLGDPRMTNSTFIEGYSVSGALHYDASYPGPADPRLSLAHGWSTGPTGHLTVSPLVLFFCTFVDLVIRADVRCGDPASRSRGRDVGDRAPSRRLGGRGRGLLDVVGSLLVQVVYEWDRIHPRDQHTEGNDRYRRFTSSRQLHVGAPYEYRSQGWSSPGGRVRKVLG